MPAPKVSFILGKNGLGRPALGFDYYSTMATYYKASSAISAYATIGDKTYASLSDAEADGVVNTCAEATVATSAQTVTTAGTNGDVVTIPFLNWDGTTITLGSYTKVTGDNTVTLVATAIVAAINALTYSTGFSATVGSSGAYTITAPKTLGVYPNSKSVTNTFSAGATMAITNNAFSGGTKSRLAVWHYQISEFFRTNPTGLLYFSIKFDDSAQSASAFNTQLTQDLINIQNDFIALNTEAGGASQVLVYAPERTFATSTMDAIKAANTTLLGQYSPSVYWLVSDTSGAALSAFANTRTLSDSEVSAIITQSSSGIGLEYFYTQQNVIGNGGVCLGVESAAAVSQSIGEVGVFNASDGTECESIQFMDASFTDYLTLNASSPNRIDTLNDYGYVFLKKYPRKTGTYIAGGNAAITVSSDYAYRENSRTIYKAEKGVYTNILDLLNSRLKLNSDGTLSDQAIAAFTEKTAAPLSQMFREGDLSVDPGTTSGSIVVSPTENVAVSSKVPITIRLVPQGIARIIEITIGFTSSL